MLTAKLLAVIVFLALGNEAKKDYPEGSPRGPNYCKMKDKYPCGAPDTNNQHLFCKCHKYKCKTFFISENVTNYRLFCMKWHNHWRNVVALGEEPEKTMYGGKIPQAADMIAVSWNYAMEDGARCNSKKCHFPFQHDACHATDLYPENGGGGQNLYLHAAHKLINPDCSSKQGTLKGCDPNTMDEYEIFAYTAIRLWYEEFKMVEKESMFSHFEMPSDLSMAKQIGHMTAVLWAKTAEIGCGAAVDEKNFRWYFGCHYWPTGVVITAPMFQIGPGASKCPADKPAGQEPGFKGLCGRSELPPEPPEDFFFSSAPILKASSMRVCYLFLSEICLVYKFVLQ